MPVYRLPDQHLFPPPEHADARGLLGIGGDLHPDRVLLAYRSGIFPWYSADQPLLWWSPDPRMVLYTQELHVGRSLEKILRRGDFTITMNQAFEQVIAACAKAPRPDQDGTWLSVEMQATYTILHQQGHAQSIEAWQDGALVGGLYGVSVGRMFCGESMFAHANNASKVAFVTLVRQLQRWGVPLVDCQVHTEHLERFGAREVPRSEFLRQLRSLVVLPGPPRPWRFDDDASPRPQPDR